MKKKIALVLILCVMATMLCGCHSTSYKEANANSYNDFSVKIKTIKHWFG